MREKISVALMASCLAAGMIIAEPRIAHAVATLDLQQTPDAFILSGSGYAVNARVIIRVTGPGAIEQNITSNFADPNGNFTATVMRSDVCAKANALITFTAEDQDHAPSRKMHVPCVKVAAAPDAAQPEAAPDAAPAEAPEEGGGGVTVKMSVDLYDVPDGGGKVTGMLGAGTQGVSLVEPSRNDWCHVTWAAGEGWVYTGPDYPALQLP